VDKDASGGRREECSDKANAGRNEGCGHADGDDEREMIEAKDGVCQTGEKSFCKRCWQFASHCVMGGCRCGER
jgi:hypothetical protein